MSKAKILISAAGTGGHLFPAQQLARLLKAKDCSVLFAAYNLSTNNFFHKNKFEYRDISSSPFNRKRIFSFFFKTLKGFFQSVFLLLKYKPDVVVGFGSYHSFPIILSSIILRKKIVLFDSNLVLGKVNTIFSKYAEYMCVQFSLKAPLKNEILVKRLPWEICKNDSLDTHGHLDLNLKKDVFTILIFGGSQGARVINDNFIDALKKVIKEYKIQVVHIIGNNYDIDTVKNFYNKNFVKSHVARFEDNMAKFYQMSDLVISRSGACTISELIYFEKPSILIPFKKAKNDHQFVNALFMQDEVNAASILEEEKISEDTMFYEIKSFLENDKKKLLTFIKNIKKFKGLEDKKNKKSLTDLILELTNKKMKNT